MPIKDQNTELKNAEHISFQQDLPEPLLYVSWKCSFPVCAQKMQAYLMKEWDYGSDFPWDLVWEMWSLDYGIVPW